MNSNWFKLVMKMTKIEYGKNLLLKGVPIIFNKGGAKLKIGENVTIKSSFLSNLVGLYSRTIIVTRAPGAEIEIGDGLKRERTEQQMRDAIAKGTLMKDLQWVPVKKDDLFFIEAGTIHAIGAGALVAEIQENSNLTYRLYDYDRVGKDGKKRELHIDKALDVANLKSSAEPKQPLRVLKYRQGIASELLTRCKYFEVYRMIVNTERRQKVHYRADEIAFRVLLCVNGCGTISYEGGNLPFYKGDCVFVPADSEVLTIHGQAQFLDVRG